MYMTIAQAAEEVGWSVRHFRRKMKDHSIPFFQINRKQFIQTAHLPAIRKTLASWRDQHKST